MDETTTAVQAAAAQGVSVEQVLSLVGMIFSTVVLTAIAVIISGKIVTVRLPLHLSGANENQFVLPLVILQLRSTGDEVAWGFILFRLSLAPTLMWGEDGYNWFKTKAGIDIGQWNTLCAIAAFISIVTSMILWIAVPLFRSAPILSPKEREDQLEQMTGPVK